MQFLANIAMAFALVSSGMLPTTTTIILAAPTRAQMMKDTQSIAETESRQCVHQCGGNNNDNNGQSSSAPAMIARQMINRPADQFADLESRQTMLSMGADEEDRMQSRQFHGGLKAVEEDAASRQMVEGLVHGHLLESLE